MSEYEFTLKFKLPDVEANGEEYLDALFEAGCDDAIIGLGHTGHIGLEFVREAESVEDAIYSAITAVKGAIDGVSLLEASPDIVGLTDAANLLNVSRQYMRQLREKNIKVFPSPLHSGNSPLYYFSDILNFYSLVTKHTIDTNVFEVANINRCLNTYRNMARLKILINTELEANDIEDTVGDNLGIPKDVRDIIKETHQLAG